MEDESLTPELKTRLEMSYARIAEDEGLTGDLTDVEARELLAWAQMEVRRLVTQTAALSAPAAEADLSAKVAHLRRHLRRVAKASASEANPADYLHTHLVPPTYPEEAPVVSEAGPPPVAPPEMPPAAVPEAPEVVSVPLSISEPPKPRPLLASFLRRWFGKKDQE